MCVDCVMKIGKQKNTALTGGKVKNEDNYTRKLLLNFNAKKDVMLYL